MSVTIKGGIEVRRRVIAFLGNYGSGKTEVAVNFTLALAAVTRPVSIVDLDIVNPYFRCREAIVELENACVETIFPKGEYFWADLPIILPEIKGVLEKKDGHVILDIGGEDMGARVLATFSDSLEKDDAEFLFVLNLSRPFTDNIEGCVKMFKEIEKAAGIEFTGIVVNTHLIHETTPEVIYNGYEYAGDVSQKTGLPISFTAVEESVLSKLDCGKIASKILPLKRIMRPPWESRPHVKLGPKNFK